MKDNWPDIPVQRMTSSEAYAIANLQGQVNALNSSVVTLRQRLAKVEAESDEKDSALADCAIALDVMAFSLVFARLLTIGDSSAVADACLNQIKCGLDAYLHVVGDGGLMSDHLSKNREPSVDNQSEEA